MTGFVENTMHSTFITPHIKLSIFLIFAIDSMYILVGED